MIKIISTDVPSCGVRTTYLGIKVVFHMESYFFEVQSSWLKPNSDPFVVTNGTLLSTQPLRYELGTWSQQKRGEGRVFRDVWHGLVDGFVFTIGIRFLHIYEELRKTHNHNRCILHGPYLFYEISVIDVPQSHPSFVPFVLCRSFVFNDTCSCEGWYENLEEEADNDIYSFHLLALQLETPSSSHNVG